MREFLNNLIGLSIGAFCTTLFFVVFFVDIDHVDQTMIALKASVHGAP